MDAPLRYVAWINDHIGFNPRAQGHSNALCSFIDNDLRASISSLRRLLESEEAIFDLNIDVPTGGGPFSRNIDMGYRLSATSAEVIMSVENKTTMTAHGRARKNRLGDLLAYCMHLHSHHPKAVAGFTIVINGAQTYKNPDEFSEVAKHKAVLKPHELEATVDLFRRVSLRRKPTEKGDRPEALAIILVEYDGLNPAKLLARPPAPQPGEPNHYETFVRRMGESFNERFS